MSQNTPLGPMLPIGCHWNRTIASSFRSPYLVNDGPSVLQTTLIKHAIQAKPYNLPSPLQNPISSHNGIPDQVGQVEFSDSLIYPVLPEPLNTGPKSTAHVPIVPVLAMRP